MRSAWIPLLVGSVIGLCIGLNETRHHGYLVPYSMVLVFFFAGVAAMIALMLLAIRRSRFVGKFCLLMILALVLTFYATIAVANRLGAWDHRMVSVGPDVRASLVIIFAKEATDSEMNEFVTTVLSTPHPGGGYDDRPGMQSLLKVALENREGYAVQFRADATKDQISFVKELASRSPIVWRIYEDIAPNQIELKEEPANTAPAADS